MEKKKNCLTYETFYTRRILQEYHNILFFEIDTICIIQIWSVKNLYKLKIKQIFLDALASLELVLSFLPSFPPSDTFFGVQIIRYLMITFQPVSKSTTETIKRQKDKKTKRQKDKQT